MADDLIERLDAVFALDPAAAAVEQDEVVWTWGSFADFRGELDALLRQHGFGAGTPVGVLLRNRPACLATALALIWTGRCLVTVNPLLPDAPLRRDLESLAVPVLVAERDDWENPVFVEAARESGSLGLAIGGRDGRLDVEIVLAPAGSSGHRPAAPGTAIEMLTSGTTGTPKRIKLELASLAKSLWAGSKYESGSDALKLHASPALLWMPLVHIGGLWNALYQFYNGRRLILLERFNIDRWHAAIVTYKMRFATLPPSALGDVLAREFPKEDFASLVAIRCGAAPLNHDHAEAFEARYGIPVLEAYGATEFAGGVAGWTIKDHRAFGKTKRRSVGRANPGIELRIVDIESFEPLGSDEEGLLEVRSRQSGSHVDWIRTTDRARLDTDGFLYILGRSDNAINRGGFKIMPETIEKALRQHPAIREACVVGIVDDRLGQVPVAAIEIHGAAPDDAELRAFLSRELKPYEIPTRYLVVDMLPRTPSLKVSQLGVRELFAVS